MKRVYFHFVICLLIFTSCGSVISLKTYRFKQINYAIQEEALINVQYEYPEIRYSGEMEIWDATDFHKNKSTGIFTKTDSIWLTSSVKDYYRAYPFGHKTYLFSSKDKKYNFHIRISEEARGWGISIINCSKYTDDEEVIINEHSKQSDRDEAIKVFEEDILPKITESVNLIKKKYLRILEKS